MPVSIHGLPRGGGKITDATATPEKVFSGEIFYNNEGRQIGTYSSTIEVKSIYIPKYSLPYPAPSNGYDPVNTYYFEVSLSTNSAPSIYEGVGHVQGNWYDPIDLPSGCGIVGVKKNGGTFYPLGWFTSHSKWMMVIDNNIGIFPNRSSYPPQIRFKSYTNASYEFFYVEPEQ